MFCPVSNHSFKSTHVDEDTGTRLLISFSEEEAKAENQSLDVGCHPQGHPSAGYLLIGSKTSEKTSGLVILCFSGAKLTQCPVHFGDKSEKGN